MLMTENLMRVSTGWMDSCFSVKEDNIIRPLAAAVLLRNSRLWGIVMVLGYGLCIMSFEFSVVGSAFFVACQPAFDKPKAGEV
jgi:hypothetical protein